MYLSYISKDTANEMPGGNVSIGLLAKADFESQRVRMQPGDKVLIVSDGVTEAENETGEFFGMDRLATAGILGGVPTIREALATYIGPSRLTDDVSIVELLYTG